MRMTAEEIDRINQNAKEKYYIKSAHRYRNKLLLWMQMDNYAWDEVYAKVEDDYSFNS